MPAGQAHTIPKGGTGQTTAPGARKALGLEIGVDIEAWDADLDAIAALGGTGIAVRTAAATWTTRTLTAPAAGITITNPAGIAGNITLVLANDLAALEGLASNGLVTRTATDTMTTRIITGTAAEITLTNGDGIAGNPTVSLPTALTFTGKTVTGGTFVSGAFNGTLGATTPSTIVATTGTFSSTLTAQALLDISGAAAGQIQFPATQNASAGANTLDDYEEGTWTPATTSQTGAITTMGTQTGWYRKIGGIVFVEADITITTNGTGATYLNIAGLPFTAVNATAIHGKDIVLTEKAVVGFISGSSTTMTHVTFYDGTYPGANGNRFLLNACYTVT